MKADPKVVAEGSVPAQPAQLLQKLDREGYTQATNFEPASRSHPAYVQIDLHLRS